MKKLLLVAGLVGSLFASDKLLSQNELNSVLKSSFLYPQFKNDIKKGIVKVQGAEKDGFYIINLQSKAGAGNIYVTKDKKYTVLGRVINNETRSVLTANFPKVHFSVNSEIVKKGIAFSFGKKGNKDLYVVTDPQCPYCKRFEEMSKGKLKDYRVHIIIMPLSFHKHAKPMTYYILAGKDDAEKLKRFKETVTRKNTNYKNFTPTKEQLAKDSKYLLDSKKAAIELGAKGTPSVYDENFNTVNWPKLVR